MKDGYALVREDLRTLNAVEMDLAHDSELIPGLVMGVLLEPAPVGGRKDPTKLKA